MAAAGRPDQRRDTAARAGKGFGWLLVLFGLAMLLLFASLGGIWLMLIGWFLTTAAAAEEQHAEITAALADVRVRAGGPERRTPWNLVRQRRSRAVWRFVRRSPGD